MLTYVQATFYFACASTVAIFYFILFLLQCLHTSVHINTDVVNLEHIRNCIQVVQIVFSYIQMCIFNNIKLEMTCALIYLKCYTNTNKLLACVRVHETYKCTQYIYICYVCMVSWIYECTCTYLWKLEACVIWNWLYICMYIYIYIHLYMLMRILFALSLNYYNYYFYVCTYIHVYVHVCVLCQFSSLIVQPFCFWLCMYILFPQICART